MGRPWQCGTEQNTHSQGSVVWGMGSGVVERDTGMFCTGRVFHGVMELIILSAFSRLCLH